MLLFLYLLSMKTLFFIIAFVPIMICAQDLKSHQWKDRILLLFADSYDYAELLKQIEDLSKKDKDLKERKLEVYQITSSSYVRGLEKATIIRSVTLYNRFNRDKKPFKVILIGLDGGVKKKTTSFINATEIFDTIDQMPMRQQELRSKNE